MGVGVCEDRRRLWRRGSGNQEHCVQEDASEKRDQERTERVHKQVVFLTEGTRGGAKDASITIKKQLIPLGQRVAGVRVSLAMTHSRGRSCHGEVKGRTRVKNGAEAGRPYGPRGTNKARVTKGRGLRSACTNLSGNSVLQSPPCPLRSLSLSPSSGMCLLHTRTGSAVPYPG